MIRVLRWLFLGRCGAWLQLKSPLERPDDPRLLMRCAKGRRHRGSHIDPLGMFEWATEGTR